MRAFQTRCRALLSLFWIVAFLASCSKNSLPTMVSDPIPPPSPENEAGVMRESSTTCATTSSNLRTTLVKLVFPKSMTLWPINFDYLCKYSYGPAKLRQYELPSDGLHAGIDIGAPLNEPFYAA